VAEDRNLLQALAYARHGWPVFPVVPGEKIPATPRGLLAATTDEAQIRAWWAANPGRNIGVATGRPGPDVVDVDRHGPEASGFAAWNAARREGLVARPMAIVRTPSSGMHAYFQGSEQRSAATAAHVDFRSTGGYVVAPHSTVGGKPYVVVHRDPESTASVDFGAVRKLIDPQRERQRQWAPPAHLRDGERQNLDHLVQHMAGLDDGRKRYLFWAANRVLDHGQPERLEDLARAARAAGSDPRQIARTIESARQQPRQDPHARVPRPRESAAAAVPHGVPSRDPEPEARAGRQAEPHKPAERQPERSARVAVLEVDRDGSQAEAEREPQDQPAPEPEHQPERAAGEPREPAPASEAEHEELARPFAEPEPEREAGE
jgi:Bifunctional DNA primase/polymerase, N-terminal